MIYELRTYMLKPGTIPEFEKRLADVLPHREEFSKLGGIWHTEFGQLNQVVHVWPYEDMAERARARSEASKGGIWPPKLDDILLSMQNEILLPAPFMRPLERRKMGDIYELRIYTYQIGTIPEVIKRWSESIPHREKFSPLAACWYSDIGGLNKWYHLWPYKDLADRDRVRAEASKDPHWPPQTREFLVSQENKLLIPAECSPLK